MITHKATGEKLVHYGDIGEVLDDLLTEENLALLKDADIKAYIDSRFENYEPNVIEQCAKTCRRNFRLLSHLVMWSRELMRNNQRDTLDNEIIESASQMLVVAQ